MSTRLRWPNLIVCLAVILGAAEEARAQADPQNYLFNAGQTIQPVFDGWAHNPDGSYEMHFGYLNRNYVEELHVPVGRDNRMTPDGPDRGQPTFFYPRVSHRVFSVTVPADWGDKELVWQVTVRDQTYRAVGWLQAEWEIAANAGGGFFGAAEGTRTNQAPTLVVDAARTAPLSGTLTMTTTVSDDGLPEPRERGRGGGRGTLPTFERNPDGPTLPINVPQLQSANRSRPTRTRVERVTVTWTQWHGPTGVTLESEGEPQDGVATVTATFTTAGEYVFKVQASDGPQTVTETITVTVR